MGHQNRDLFRVFDVLQGDSGFIRLAFFGKADRLVGRERQNHDGGKENGEFFHGPGGAPLSIDRELPTLIVSANGRNLLGKCFSLPPEDDETQCCAFFSRPFRRSASNTLTPAGL
jgi:hypothetical protein